MAPAPHPKPTFLDEEFRQEINDLVQVFDDPGSEHRIEVVVHPPELPYPMAAKCLSFVSSLQAISGWLVGDPGAGRTIFESMF
jgi:hypothetical protein